MDLPLAMRKPRKARPVGGSRDGWWYIDPNGITVYAETTNRNDVTSTTSVRLTRRQLERALDVMADYLPTD